MEEIEIRLYGRVQGVGFRRMIRRYCVKNGIFGFVKNHSDGSVQIVAQAKKEKICSLLSWIATNPGFSSIKQCDYSWQESSIDYKEFKIVSEVSFVAEQARNFLNLGKSFFSAKSVPVHVAIIPDGNRRWAKSRGFKASYGHYKAGSYDNIKSLIKAAEKMGIKYLSVWGFSTENWKRDSNEVNAIFDLLIKDIALFKKDSERDKIRFRHFGRKDRLPKKLVDALSELEELTKNHKGISVQLCLDYGGKDELIRAVNAVIASKRKRVDAKIFSSYLDSGRIPDPDLIIRTSGEKRLSGFMPWQSGYAELYFSEKYFPDFGVEELREAVKEFGRRKRRFGG